MIAIISPHVLTSHKKIRTNVEKANVETEAESVIAQEQVDPRVERGIMVARDGYLNGRSESMTVGNILDAYSDTAGKWLGYVDENNSVLIYYQGSRNGENFAIQFEVFSDDTFRITGAARNGEQIETYSDFFQQILNDVGV